MGRQIAVAMGPADEDAFLDFLRFHADIQLFEYFAPTPAALSVTRFNPTLQGHWVYTIWNRVFPFTPSFGVVSERASYTEHIGWSFIANVGTAPVIEFTRSDVASGRYGRLYWAKDFSAPRGLNYDVGTFQKWYEAIVRWVWATSAGKEKRPLVTWSFLRHGNLTSP